MNLDTSFILEELNEKKYNESKPSLIKKKNTRKKRNFNPFSMVILSGALGLFSSIMLLKYIQKGQNDSINLQRGDIFLLNKNISS